MTLMMKANSVFPILGAEEVPLVGREKLVKSIWADLTKETPANLSVIGPRYIGKSVILNKIAELARTEENSPYQLVIYWELGHAPPQSDDEFIEQLCNRLVNVLGDAAFADHRAYLNEEKTYGILKEVMDLLQTENVNVLMIWDGFDKPLSQGKLTGGLLGNLRDLFNGKKHKVVVATRANQAQFARNKQVEDSPFWNVLDPNAISIGPMNDDDLVCALEVAGLKGNQGGLKELYNWTGHRPVLLLSMLNCLGESGSKEFTNAHVNETAKHVSDELQEFLGRLWESFDTDARKVFYSLSEGDVENDRIGKLESKFLVAGGFAAKDGKKHSCTCRLLSEHVEGTKDGASAVGQLFGEWENYRNEIRTILELRLGQIPIFDRGLNRLVKRAIEDIPDYPNYCLNNLTSIEEEALDFIWKYEFDGGVVPKNVIAYWTTDARTKDNIISDLMAKDDWRTPKDRFKQLALLQRLTGSKADFEPKAAHVSKDTYVLLNAIHQFRNRSEHADGQPIHEGVAVSALLLCIELLSCLAREIGGK